MHAWEAGLKTTYYLRTLAASQVSKMLDVAAVKEYLRDSEVYSVSDNGVSIGYFSFNLTSDKTVELKSIALLPSYQGKGIGKQMLDKLFELTQGCIINLVVHPGNTAALISYLKNGFVIKGWKEDYFEDNQPRILMETCFD